PLDRTMQLPLTLAGGLRTTFADVVSSPLPDRVAALVSRLQADRNERSGEERKRGNRNRNVEPYFVEDDNHRMPKRRSRAANRREKARADPFRGSREDCEEKSRWQPTTHTAQRHGSAYRSRST